MAAASAPCVCPTVPVGGAWTTGNPATGGLTSVASLNGWGGTGYGQSNVFVSLRDNSSTAAPATVSTSTSLRVCAGKSYVFTIQVLSQHGDLTVRPVPTRAGTVQSLDITLDGSRLQLFSTYADQTPGSTQTVIRNSTSVYPWATYTYNYTAAQTKNVELKYLFTLPPRIGVSQDDIFVTLPQLTCVN